MLQPLTTQTSENTRALVDAAGALTAQTFTSVDDAVASVLNVASRLLRSRTLFLTRFDTIEPAGRALNVLTVLQREGGSTVKLGISGPVEDTLCNNVWMRRAPVLIEDIQNDPEFNHLALPGASDLGSYIGVPLLYANGEVYGTLCGVDPEPLEMRSHPELVDLLQILARLLISYIERDEINSALQQQRDLAHGLLQSERAARADADAANTLRRKIAAIISYELRAPLASIAANASALLASGTPEQQAELAAVDHEAQQLSQLIDQVFELTQIETGLFNVRPEIHSFSGLVADIRPELESAAKNHPLEIDALPTLPDVWADPPRIVQLLTKLVSFAGQYSPSGSPIRLSASAQDGDLRVDVTDQGDGIPAEVRDVIFDAFEQLDKQQLGNIDGTRLGLSVCKGIVDAHGGRIWIDDRPEKGTTISFTLLTTSD